MPPRPLFVIFFAVVALLVVLASLAASPDPAVESAFPLPLDRYQNTSGTALLEVPR